MANFSEKVRRTSKAVAEDVRRDLTYFTPGLAVAHTVGDLPLRGKFLRPAADWAGRKKDREILSYLEKTYGDVLRGADREWKPIKEEYHPAEAPIWFCWLQGEEEAPPLVKRCIASIRRNAGRHPVHLLTQADLSFYIHLPPYILEKYHRQMIGAAHFSDVVRVMVLQKYGGLWLDATIFCTAAIPNQYFEREFFSCKGPVRESRYISHYRWTTFVLGGRPGGKIYTLLKCFFEHYWEREQAAIDYLFMDYAIELLYRLFSDVKNEIDALPENNLERDNLAAYMGRPFSQERWDTFLTADTGLYKLSWREKWAEKMESGEDTFFGYFLKDMEK